MNAYDFDKTIFAGDSTAKFYVYCLVRHPSMLRRLPKLIWEAATLLKKDKQRFKQNLFAFLTDLPDPQAAVNAFWDKHLGGIKPFYLARKRSDDVIISASPEFLIVPAMERLGVRTVMASPVDIATGLYRGLNCHGEEKVRRLRERLPGAEIDEFYSDSRSDTPMAKISKRAFLVKGNKIRDWGE